MRRVAELNLYFKVQGSEIVFKKVPLKSQKIKHNGFVLETECGKNTFIFKLEKADGKEMDIEQVKYDVHFPLLNYARVLVPDSGRFYMNTVMPRQIWVEHPKFLLAGRAFGNPFLALSNQVDELEVGFGLLGDLVETEVFFYSPGASRKNTLLASGERAKVLFTKPVGEGLKIGRLKEFWDGFFVIEREDLPANKRSWFFALREYGKCFRQLRGLDYEVSDSFFSPALCTWRVINSDNMTHEWVLKMAEEAAKLGLKAFIFDDGWYGVGLDSPKMVNDMGDWPRRIPGKFDDISKTVKEVQKLGLKAILWYGPICVGKDSKIFPKVKHLLIKVKNERGEKVLWDVGRGFYTLCPRNPEARKIMLENLKKLIMDYGADGVKIDLFDYMPAAPCVADHEHDLPNTTEGVKAFFREGGLLVRKLKPGAIFSIKNNYGNVELAPFASVVRGGDSPFDEDINFWRSVYPAAYAPVVHNDYLIWSRKEDPLTLACALIKQITSGVPNFSVNLLKLSKIHKRIMAAWLNFFSQRLDLYKNGVFEPQSHHFFATSWQRVTETEAMVTVISPGSEVRIPDRKEIYVLNATNRNWIWVVAEKPAAFEAEYFDHTLSLLDKNTIELYTGCRLRVLPCGLTVLKKL